MILPVGALAWRNVWRNRRRSALTLLTIGSGLAAVMLGHSLMKTLQRQMVEKSTGAQTGHLQVQARGNTDRKIPTRLFARPAGLERALLEDPRTAGLAARLVFTGLVYSAAGSRGVLVTGVEPESERRVSILPSYIVEGRYLGAGERDLALGEKLARELDVRLGEKLVVMAQAPSGEMNSELFRVAGIYRSGSESFDAQAVYIPLAPAQRLKGAEGRLSCLVARLKDVADTDAAWLDLSPRFRGREVELLTYREIGLEVASIIKFEDAVMVVVLSIIFLIVGLGILNTISMSMFERVREFGVLRAIGARRGLVARMLLAEGLLLGVGGAAAGLLLGGGLIAWWGATGLDLPVGKAVSYWLPFESTVYLRPVWRLHLLSAAGLVGVSVAAAAGPATRAARLRVAEALRHL